MSERRIVRDGACCNGFTDSTNLTELDCQFILICVEIKWILFGHQRHDRREAFERSQSASMVAELTLNVGEFRLDQEAGQRNRVVFKRCRLRCFDMKPKGF
ncbi:MAG: hypothetical protein WAV47_06905, partial [Blastocatellia bacterium]